MPTADPRRENEDVTDRGFQNGPSPLNHLAKYGLDVFFSFASSDNKKTNNCYKTKSKHPSLKHTNLLIKFQIYNLITLPLQNIFIPSKKMNFLNLNLNNLTLRFQSI